MRAWDPNLDFFVDDKKGWTKFFEKSGGGRWWVEGFFHSETGRESILVNLDRPYLEDLPQLNQTTTPNISIGCPPLFL